jgi:transcription antitermination factor NusG
MLAASLFEEGGSSGKEFRGAQRLFLEEGERWFVARVRPHWENAAQLNLHQQGFRSFTPKTQRTVRHARKLRNVLAPLFSGYVFVIFNPSIARWRNINSTSGVTSLIMSIDQPIPVPRGIVEALVASTDNSGTVQFDRDLEIGQRVRILSGPFADTLCRLAELDDRGRVRVLFEFMGAEVSPRLDRSLIAPAA